MRIRSFFQYIRLVISQLHEYGISMRIKLFLLLTLLVVSTILGVLVILTITGTLTAGIKETEKAVSLELTHLSQEISRQYDQVSSYTIEYAKDVSDNIETRLTEKGKTIEDLKNDPELLEALIESQFERSLFSMQRANCSGVFFILDATVNPNLPEAENSKAGLYIKNMEPNILNSGSSYVLIFRGSSSIGRLHSLTLHSQWRMEFDVSDARYYSEPFQAAKEKTLPLSRLYYWSPAFCLPGSSEQVMLCSVPLVDSRGNVFGVCGFEVSSMLFKLSHMPENDAYRRLICIMGPVKEDRLNVSEAFLSGSYSARDLTANGNTLLIRENRPFHSYRQENGKLLSGLHGNLSLYPEDSAFESEKWITVIAMPDEDISASVIRMNVKLLILFSVLLLIGILSSYILSRKFLMPLSKGIQIIKSNDYLSRTKIPEIDDLIEFLSCNPGLPAGQSEDPSNQPKSVTEEMLPSKVFEEFVKNTKLLSPAERAVFNLYVEGYTAKEITGILCLSINTIKTHNKRIYMKLNVASREELLVYVSMLKEAGKEI